MVTIPIPVVMNYTLDNNKQFREVRHFDLIKGKDLFSKKLNISKDRMCARSRPKFWLKIRDGNKWSGWITGLFPTSYDGWYYGDTKNKKNQLIFHFEGSRLQLFYLPNFYTGRVSSLIKFLKEKY